MTYGDRRGENAVLYPMAPKSAQVSAYLDLIARSVSRQDRN
jgi:hypothetical protein